MRKIFRTLATLRDAESALTLFTQAFRKAIGVRIKEETELIEGEVRAASSATAAPQCSMLQQDWLISYFNCRW